MTTTQTDGRTVSLIDVTLRDAHQCLWATRMTTAMMGEVSANLDRAGFEAIDLVGGAVFDVFSLVRYSYLQTGVAQALRQRYRFPFVVAGGAVSSFLDRRDRPRLLVLFLRSGHQQWTSRDVHPAAAAMSSFHACAVSLDWYVFRFLRCSYHAVDPILKARGTHRDGKVPRLVWLPLHRSIQA